MRKVLLIVILFFSVQLASAQNVSYNVPEGYENSISKEDYRKIADLAIPIISKYATIIQLKDGAFSIDKGQKEEVVYLQNLIIKCLSVSDKSKWEELINEHFTALFTISEEEKQIDPYKFETVRNYLSLRVYPDNFVDRIGKIENLVLRTDLEGTKTVLMFDFPGKFATVFKNYVPSWKVSDSELFAIAQANVNKQEMIRVTKSFDFGGTENIELSFLENEDYAASYILDLAHNAPEFVGELGTALAVPNKGFVTMCKIGRKNPVDFIKYIQRTNELVTQAFDNHPQSVSKEFFWYYRGKFTRIPVSRDSLGNVSVTAPFELGSLIE